MHSDKHGLTFHWPDRPEISLARPGFFILAILIHASAFYLFQISYPKAAPIPPPPGEVSLLAPVTEENRSILSWVSAQRPSFAPSLRQPIPAGMLELEYSPSFAQVQTQPSSGEEIHVTTKYPGIGELSAITPERSSDRPGKDAIAPGKPTRFHFSEAISGRVPDQIAEAEWPGITGDIPTPASFLIGIDPDGQVRFIFPQTGSGSVRHDVKAEENLAAIHFKPGKNLDWGIVKVQWGVDALQPAATGTAAPQPASQP